jgi:hypothetical protein
VPDDYANSDASENLAQIGVLSLFDIVVPGGIAALGKNWTCLGRQIKVLQGFEKARLTPGGKCDRHWDDSPSMPINTSYTTVSNSNQTVHAVPASVVNKRVVGADGRMGRPPTSDAHNHDLSVHAYDNLVCQHI